MKFIPIVLALTVCLVASGHADEPKHGATDVPDFLPEGTTALPEMTLNNASAYKHENRLLLVLDTVPESGLQQMPRICNVVEAVHWLGGESEEPLTLLSEITEWSVKLKDAPTNRPPVLVLTLDAKPRLFDDRVISTADDDGVIHLPAKFARTTGEKLRFEPQPHKNTVGYWTVEQDTAEWQFRVDKAGEYEVEIFQGCGKGQGGSNVDVVVGEQTLSFVVEDTGHFQNFVWRKLGRLTLSASDRSVLKLVATRKAVNAVMDAREIRLIPVNE